MYIDPNKRLEDAKSTAYSFIGVAIFGIAGMVKADFTLNNYGTDNSFLITSNIVMGLLFLIFLGIGIHSALQVKKYKELCKTTVLEEEEIKKWFLENHKDTLLSFSPILEEDNAAQESSYYPRMEFMTQLLDEKYQSIDPDFKEHILEELYSDIFNE